MGRPTTQDEIRETYNKYYAENDMYERSDFFYEWLLQATNPPAGAKLLDVSCGEGHFLKQVEALGKGLEAHGIDISDTALEKARTRVKKAELRQGNSEALPYAEGTFDVVTNTGSLEHYLNRDKAVAEMFRVLKPGGKAMVLVPNRYHWRDIWRALRKGRGQLPTEQGLEHTDSREGWKDLFKAAGFRVARTLKYERVAKPTPRNPTPRRMVWYHLLVPLNVCFSFVYILRKPD